MARRLRIAASVFFAVLAVLLCVLWMRSYWVMDSLDVPLTESKYLLVQSRLGEVFFFEAANDGSSYWELRSYEIPADWTYVDLHVNWALVSGAPNTIFVAFPYWFAVGVLCYFSVLPWISRSSRLSLRNTRFTLRTLLLVVTLAALVLGLGIWLAS